MKGSLVGAELDGRYRIVRRIGAGGMGTVFEAVIRSSGARVAIKTLSADYAERPDAAARFRRESRVASSILHPNVVRTLDVGVANDGAPYIVMELLRGASLAQILQRGAKLELSAIVAVLRGVLEGLVAAHAVGVVHRDLKPDNVFLHASTASEEATPKIVDFGISKMRGAESLRVTGTGVIVGSPYYMAPEQARGAPDVDLRADVYGAGAIAYELLSGQRPYADATAQMILLRVLREPPKSLRELAPDCPPSLVAWVERAMAHDREDRFSSAGAALGALLDSVRGLVGDADVVQARRALRELVETPATSDRPSLSRAIPDDAPTLAEPIPRSLVATPSTDERKSDRRRDEKLVLVAAVLGALSGAYTMFSASRGLGRLDLSTFGSPTSTAVGAGLVSIAWLVIGVGSSFARARGLARPLAVLAYTQAVYLVHVAMREIVPAIAAQRLVFVLGEGASLWTLPTSLQIALRLAGREGPRSRLAVRALYAVAAVTQLLVGTRWYGTMRDGTVVAGPLLLALVPLFVAALGWGTIVLARATLRQADVERRRRGFSLVVGLPLYGILQLGDAASYAGSHLHPPTLLSFFPIGMIGYGAIGADLLVTQSGIQRALRIGRNVALRLLAIVVTLGVVLLGRTFHAGVSLRLIAPPAITAALCLALAWQALGIEEATASTVAWGILVALVGFLKLDITLLALVDDMRTALWISRIDHFFFVFTPVVVVHVLRSVTRWRSQRWIVWCFWIAALVVAPLTLSDAYFSTTVHHWFGWFARAGWIYLAYQVVQSAALGYALGILVSAMVRARRNARLGYALILLGFGSAAALLLLGDQRSVLGEDVYPYGNFAFVSFALIAWGILRGELADFRGVVRSALAHGIVSTILTGMLAATIVFVVRFTDEAGPLVAAVCAALVTMVGLAPVRGWAQRGVDGMLGTDRFDEAEAFRDFTDATSGSMRPHDVADAARRVVEHTFRPTAAAVLLRVDDGGFARGPFTLDAEDPALLELRRTLEVVRCGGARMPTPAGLVGWRGAVVLVPLAHRGRMLGVLAVAPSPRAPLVSRRAVGFLRSFADHVALVLENASLNADLEGAVERRTAELAELVAKLESAARKAQDAGDARAELVQSVRVRAEEMRRTNPDAQSRAAIDAALDLVESTLTPGGEDMALAETAVGADSAQKALRASRRNESGPRRVR